MNEHTFRNVDLEGQSEYEMQPNNNNTTTLLNKCRTLNTQITHLTQTRLQTLQPAQQALLDSSSSAEDHLARQRLDHAQAELTRSVNTIRSGVLELRRLVSGDPRVEAQFGVVRKNLEREIGEGYKCQREFEGRLRGQVRRRYEIENPGASEVEVEEGVERVLVGEEMSFQIQGTRTHQAREAQAAVMARSAAIRQIEQDLMTLSQLMTEVASLVESHDVSVEKINESTAKTVDDTQNANQKLSFAVISARNAKRYKWYILWVCVLIIAIVVSVPIAYCFATGSCGTRSN